MKDFSHHLKHFLPLLGILISGFVGYSIFSYAKNFQMAVVLACAGGYISWGLVHHHMHKDLSLVVILEYISIAVVGIVIIYSVIF